MVASHGRLGCETLLQLLSDMLHANSSKHAIQPNNLLRHDGLLQATVMVVSVTASTTAGQPLSDDNLQKLLHACDVALQLDKDKADILKLVQMKMHHIAPNLSAAVGTEIAARLMGIAGGLTNLSKMPACNVQVSRRLVSPTVPRQSACRSRLCCLHCT